MGAVKNLCHSGILLNQGMIEYAGTAEDCINTYVRTNIQELSSECVVTEAMRLKQWSSGEITFEHARLLNNPAGMATDEPIELEFTMKRHFGDVVKCKYSVNVWDETDSRIVGYVTDDLPVPDSKEYKVHITLTNHSLTARRYKLSFTVGYKDFGSNMRSFDIVEKGALSFEVKYMRQEDKIEYSHWDRNWGAVIHQGCNISAEIV